MINRFIEKREHMSIQNNKLNQTFIDNGFTIETNNSEKIIIKKCDDIGKCVIKEYETPYFNNKKSHYTAKNKPLSNSIFQENNIPVPYHQIITEENMNHYLNHSNNLNYPVVLKPVDGMQGTDVNTFIKNPEQFKKILIKLLTKYNKVMLENQVYGDNYRIFVFNDTVIDVIKREQPYVIGNGMDTVYELINKKNSEQTRNNLFPTNNLDWDYIKEQGFQKDSIPESNKKIFITNTINFHNGANPVRVPINTISKDNIDLFIKAHQLIDLECSGIDYMSNDITVPYYMNDGHIIEINDMVDTKIHVDADNGSSPDFLFDNIIKTFL
jgi:cyanophycin synthetase